MAHNKTNVNELTLGELRAHVSNALCYLQSHYDEGWEILTLYETPAPGLRSWLLTHFPLDYRNGPQPSGYGSPRYKGIY